MITFDKIPTDDLDQCRGMWVESATGELGIIRKTFYSVKRHSCLVQVLWPAFEHGSGAHTHFPRLIPSPCGMIYLAHGKRTGNRPNSHSTAPHRTSRWLYV